MERDALKEANRTPTRAEIRKAIAESDPRTPPFVDAPGANVASRPLREAKHYKKFLDLDEAEKMLGMTAVDRSRFVF